MCVIIFKVSSLFSLYRSEQWLLGGLTPLDSVLGLYTGELTTLSGNSVWPKMIDLVAS